MKTLKVLFTVAVVIALSTSSAKAGILFGFLNDIQFEDRELEIDAGVSGVSSPGRLDVGDRLLGVLVTNQITADGVNQIPPSPEVTGVFDVTAAFLINAANGTLVTDTSSFSGTIHALFAPTASATSILGSGSFGTFTGLGLAAGSMVALFEGGAADVLATLDSGASSTADVFGAASDGTFLGDFGFGGGVGSSFVAADDINEVSDWGVAGNGYWWANVLFGSAASLPAGVSDPITQFYYGLEALTGPIATVGGGPIALLNSQLIGTNPFGTSITDNRTNVGITFFDFVGKGSTSLNSDTANSDEDKAKFPLFSNDPAQVHPSPEPSTLVLLGIGALCGIPALRRRKKNQTVA